MKMSEIKNDVLLGGDLIGKSVNGKVIDEDTPNSTWEESVDFDVRSRELVSLNGAPMSVSGDFNCSFNNLKSLEGAPRTIGHHFNADHNKKLVELGCRIDVIGAGRTSHGAIWGMENTGLTSLHDVHKCVKKAIAHLFVTDTKIRECVLGLLLVESLRKVTYTVVKRSPIMWSAAETILNTYLLVGHKYDGGSRSRVIDCQNELLDVGLDEYAKL